MTIRCISSLPESGSESDEITAFFSGLDTGPGILRLTTLHKLSKTTSLWWERYSEGSCFIGNDSLSDLCKLIQSVSWYYRFTFDTKFSDAPFILKLASSFTS